LRIVREIWFIVKQTFSSANLTMTDGDCMFIFNFVLILFVFHPFQLRSGSLRRRRRREAPVVTCRGCVTAAVVEDCRRVETLRRRSSRVVGDRRESSGIVESRRVEFGVVSGLVTSFYRFESNEYCAGLRRYR
jgi:hypothetical protein